MIKDQASALREMIRMKKEGKQPNESTSSQASIRAEVSKDLPTEEVLANKTTQETVDVVTLNPDVSERSNKFSNDEVLSKISLLTESNEKNKKEIKIFGIGSGNVGVGRSNLLLNIAITFQQQGKKTLIIDLNLGESNIAHLCGVNCVYSLDDVLCGDKTIKDVCAVDSEGIAFINGGSKMFETEQFNEDSKKWFENQLAELKDIDVILVDMGAGVSKASILYSMFVQELILVVNPDSSSVTETYNFLKLIDQYQFKKEVRIVINKTINEDEAKRTFDLLHVTSRKFLSLNLKYIGFIHNDALMINSVKLKQPLILNQTNSLAAQDIRQVAQKLIEVESNKRTPQTMREVAQRFLHVFG